MVSEELAGLVREQLQKQKDVVYRLKAGEWFEKPEFLRMCDTLDGQILKENSTRKKIIPGNIKKLKKLCPSNSTINQIQNFMFIYDTYTGEILGNDLEEIPRNSEAGEYSVLFPGVNSDGAVTKNGNAGMIKLDGKQFHAKLDQAEEEKEPYHTLFAYVFDDIIYFRYFGWENGDKVIDETVKKYNEEINKH